MTRVLVVGSTGSIGRVLVPTLVARGTDTVAFVRDEARGSAAFPGVALAVGDVTDQASVAAAVRGADAVIMTHGGSDGGEEEVDYGAVPAVLRAAGTARPRIVLMTSMSVSHPAQGPWFEAMEWKRRGERLLRVSGFPYVVVRPGWFDLERAGENSVVFEQGDALDVQVRRGISRQRIADTLANAAVTEEALGATFELFGAAGEPPADWAPLFGALAKDAEGALDGARDVTGPALADEPQRVRDDMYELGGREG